MKARPWFVVLAVALGSAACGAPASPAGAPPASGACPVTPHGALVTRSHLPAPAPAPTGGALADGDYDLAEVRVYDAPGEMANDGAPAYRASVRFTTSERAPGLTKGTMVMATDVPPATRCDTLPFAAMGTELRTFAKGTFDAAGYSVLPNGDFVLHKERVSQIFRKRP